MVTSRIIFTTRGKPIVPSNFPMSVPGTHSLWIITRQVYDEASDTSEYQGVKYDPAAYYWQEPD